MFTGRPPFVWMSNAYASTGLETVSLTCMGDNAPGLDPSSGPPTQCLDGSGPETGKPTINVLDSDFRFPQDLKISLGLDQDLPLGLVGSVEWLYSKAINQIVVAGTYWSVAEGIALGLKAGLDMESVVKAVGSGAAGSWAMVNRSGNMINNDYPLGFKVALHHKDLNIALEEAINEHFL